MRTEDEESLGMKRVFIIVRETMRREVREDEVKGIKSEIIICEDHGCWMCREGGKASKERSSCYSYTFIERLILILSFEKYP